MEEKETVAPEVVEESKSKYDGYVMKLPEGEEEQTRYVEPNSPAHWSMRIAGGIIDLCILLATVFGLIQLFLITPMGDPLRSNSADIQEILDMYKLQSNIEGVDETLGYKVYENQAAYNEAAYRDYQVYPRDDESALHYKVIDYKKEEIANYEALVKAYNNTINSLPRYNNLVFDYNLRLFGIIMLSTGISEAIFLFVIPLTNKYRATIGNLFSGSQVINSKYYSPAKWYQILMRFLFILVVESALPFYFLFNGNYLYAAIWCIIIMSPIIFLVTLTNKDRKTLHDFVSRTKVIDKRSFVQLTDM